MLRYTTRELFLLTVLLAVLTAWFIDRARLASEIARPRAEAERLEREADRLRHEIYLWTGYQLLSV
jgi:hypothetical protein